MGSIAEPSFSALTQLVTVHGLLFDFDGTIIDSTAAIVKYWHKQGRLLGVDPNAILATSHGRRSIDVLKIYDESRANWEYVCHEEGLIPKQFGNDAVEIPGARKLLASLDSMKAPWAVVTSGTSALLNGWIDVLQLAHPQCVTVAEDVVNGKPDPECYLLGCQRLGFTKQHDLIVIEDAPSGIRAGKAAGFKVIGLATTHTIDEVQSAGADWIIRDLGSVTAMEFEDGTIQLEIREALVL